MAPLRALVERGRRAAAFRSYVPAGWLVTVFFGLLHAADEHVRAHDLERDEALARAAATTGEVVA